MRERGRGKVRSRLLAAPGPDSTKGSIPGPVDNDLSPRQKLNHLSHPNAQERKVLSTNGYMPKN